MYKLEAEKCINMLSTTKYIKVENEQLRLSHRLQYS